jgi:hypothetical protein
MARVALGAVDNDDVFLVAGLPSNICNIIAELDLKMKS